MAKKDSKKSKEKSKDKSKSKEKSKGKPAKSKKGKASKVEEFKGAELLNVRLSHPHIFQRSSYDGETGKFEATFLIPKDTKQGKKTKKMLDAMIADAVEGSKVKKVKDDMICLRDGDDSDKPEYFGHWTIKASRNKRPAVLDGDGDPTSEEDEVVYAGCFVNALIEFWVQNNKYGKRVNANLIGVKFYKDGDPFTSGMSSEQASDILNGKGDGGKY